MQFDILDPQLYAGDPFPVYRWLRHHSPVHRDEKNGLWIVSRYADVVHVSKNPRLFSSAQGVMPDVDTPISIVTMDDPRHTQLRSLISRGFTPRMVRQLQLRIGEVVRECVDAALEKSEFDFVEEISVPLPLRVIAEMIGIRPEDRTLFGEWSDTMILAAAQNNNIEILMRAHGAYVEYAAYLQDVFEDRRRAPREDLVSILVAAQSEGRLASDGDNLSNDELIQFMTLLLVAGNETTRNGLSGGMLAMLENPEQWAKLKARPELVPVATEEILRYVSPIVGFRRTATADTEVGGERVREGEKVLMIYQSANRDEGVFNDPDRFLVDRENNDHLAFGIGTHFCLGANLARVEIRAVFDALIERTPDLALEGPPVRIPSPLVRTIGHLPVSVRH